MKIIHAKLIGAFVLCVMRSLAASLSYQPSPYKGTDLWITNYYSYNDDYGVNEGRLRVGGWGDWYSSALKFDLEGLPKNPTQVVLYMWAYSPNDGSTPVSMNAYALTNDWDENSGWYNPKWMGYSLGQIGAPTSGRFNGIGMLSLYKQWKDGYLANKGIYFSATANNNRFNNFHSSDFSVPLYRPYLYIEYTETVTPPNFKLPLPGGRKWVVTTEIGSGDAKNPNLVLSSHSGINYFSLDFGTSSSPAYSGDIPIYAAASGVVVRSAYSSANGNYVVLNHSGVQSESVGYTTRYLHFKYFPSVSEGSSVIQGQLLGYMGNTGDVFENGTHLHFGVRYAGSGSSSVNELSFVKMEGLPLKQYQTEVDSSGNRHINSYFTSTNTP